MSDSLYLRTVTKFAVLTAEEGEYSEVGRELNGVVYSVQIPGIASSNVSGTGTVILLLFTCL